MIQLLKTASVFAVVIAVLGAFTVYGNGRIVDSAFAQKEGPPPGGDCCEGPPPDSSPPPDSAPPPGDFSAPPPGGEFSGPLPGDGFFAPPDGSAPPPDGFDPSQPPPEGFAGPVGKGGFQVEFFQGGQFNPEVGGFFKEGPGGEFRFDSDPNQAPPPGGLDPGAFSEDFFAETFRPGEFKGDFGQFFTPGAFGKGELDAVFTPGDFRPQDFGTLFNPQDFNPGEFGKFAAVGDEFVDFGGHFDQFFGERGDEAKAATEFFKGVNPGDFRGLAPDALLQQVQKMDYQGFQGLDKDVVVGLFNQGLAGQHFDLKGEQWAGAFSKFDPQDIKGFDRGFIENAVHDFSKADFLGIPGDRAFALFESTFFGEAGFAPGGPGGPPPNFDPQAFAGKLDEFGGQLDGFMGAFGKDQYGQLGGDMVANMMGKIDFAGEGFDPTVFTGEDVGHAFAAMDFEHIQGLGDKVFDAVGKFKSGDLSRWDPKAAFDVFNAGNFEKVKGLGQIDGLVGAMGPEFLKQVDGDKRVELFQGFEFGGEDFAARGGSLNGKAIAGLMAGMGKEHIDRLGGQGILDAMKHVGELEDLDVLGGDSAFDVFNAVGLDGFRGTAQFDGLVANFRAGHIREIGDKFGDILDNLDFKANKGILGGFSFDALDAIAGGQAGGLGRPGFDPGKLADLANSVGGGEIFRLDREKLAGIVDNLDTNGFSGFDPSVVGGLFAGLDQDQIGGFGHETMAAALKAAGADLLGGLGDFNAIAGAYTSFGELANFGGLEGALEQDGSSVIQEGVFNFFGGNLFGSN